MILNSGHGPEPDHDLGTIAAETVAPRVPGALAGQIRIHNDFDAPLPKEIADAFEVQ